MAITRAKYGAEAHKNDVGALPTAFPRTMGPNCMKYLQEIVDSGLMCNMTERFEQAFAREIGMKHCIATPGCTPALHVLAAAFPFKPGDEIIVSQLEHHSNYVPWYQLCQRKDARFRVLPFTPEGELDPEVLRGMFTEKTRLLALNQVSNSLGTVNPLETIIPIAHAAGVPVLVDAAQSVQHLAERDVQALDADFYAFSGHKMYGPMGIGVLYAKESWLEKIPPFLFGGEMIDQVSSTRVTFAQLPFKFEAGTPNVEGAVGLGAAVDYLNQFDPAELQAYEDDLLAYGIAQLREIPELILYGKPRRRSSIMPFNVAGIQHYDMGVLLDTSGIAVRTGQHCTQPIMDALSISGTVRASLALYNNREDIDALTRGIRLVMKMLKR